MGRKVDYFGEANEAYKKNYAYMQSVIPRLLEAEKTVREIKQSKEWKYTINYFTTMHARGKLKYRPRFENGYAIVLAKPSEVVTLETIEDILTPEQKELIMQRIKEG